MMTLKEINLVCYSLIWDEIILTIAIWHARMY